MPWASDGYSPLDLTLLDHHHGVIADWRAAVAEIHARGMYIILDNTMATMGDLIGKPVTNIGIEHKSLSKIPYRLRRIS